MFLSAPAEMNILRCKERKMKKIIALFLAVMFCFIAVSCTTSGDKETTTVSGSTEPITTTSGGTTSGSSTETTTSFATETTEEKPPVVEPQKEVFDIENEKAGNYVTVHYNKATCTVETEVKKGVGSKESVTVTVTMRDGFIYDGISIGNAIINNTPKTTSKKTYTVTNTSNKVDLYVNTSMKVIYHTGEGKTYTGSDTKEVTFPLVGYHNPSTLEEDGYFVRDGYTLVEYNTAEDGSGTPISLGGRADAEGKAVLDLWCVWQKNTDSSLFKYKNTSGGVEITGYTGNEEVICIPEKMGGKAVVSIAGGAFNNADMKKVIIAKSVTSVESGAFRNCKNLETVVVFDGGFDSYGISDRSFENCENFKHFYVNGTFTLYNFWSRYGATHLDRLMWAKDRKKIVIIGGSGSYYGYDSEIIEKALDNEYEIINFGENANISGLLYFDLIEEFLGEGDIVLWSPEPGRNTLGSYDIGYRAWYFRQYDYNFLRYIDCSQFSDIISSFSKLSGEMKEKRFANNSFLPLGTFTNSTSKYGDGLDQENRVTQGRENNYNLNFEISTKKELAAIIDRINNKGASVYFTYAAMQKDGGGISDNAIKEYTEKLTSVLDITVISDYKNCLFPQEYFWDSEWHLVWEGAQERSRHVAEDLKKQLGK